MNSNATPPPSNSTPQRRPRARRLRWIVAALVCLVLVAGACVVLHRLRGPDSQETVLLGQKRLAADSPAALRVLVRHRGNWRPVSGAKVEVRLQGKGFGKPLGRFVTGADGSTDTAFGIPDVAPGQHSLVVDVRSPLGRDRIECPVEVCRPCRVLLTTDKPVYQPGQTVHIRALASNARTLKPLSSEPVAFEIADARGNKVFRQAVTCSRFGIASADFTLARELDPGRCHVQASCGGASAERAIEVKHYVLPKFKIEIDTDRSWYGPGETIFGTVKAGYFFGKPVRGAAVRVRAETMHERPVEVAHATGTTDGEGRCGFRLPLPAQLAGMPLHGGRAGIDLTVEVEDTGSHREHAKRSITASSSSLELALIPECGILAPGVENLVYVLTAYPDGQPAECRITANGKGYRTDSSGACAVPVVPTGTNYALEVTASDARGRCAAATVTSDATRHAPPLLLRADKAVYETGQDMRLSLFSPQSAGTVFVDLVHDRQTVLTRSLEMRNGRGEMALSLPPDLTGLLRVNAYIVNDRGEDWGHSRLVYVNPASGLHVEARPDKEVYAPGEKANLQLAVSDPQGRPTPAALGLCAVDESVFRPEDGHPGLAGQFIAAELDLLKPRFQTVFFSSPARLLRGDKENESLCQAWLASVLAKRASEVDCDALEQYLPAAIIERIRGWRGTPAYESLRNNPVYARAIRYLEQGTGSYDLRSSSGPVKQLAAERRRARFIRLVNDIIAGSAIAVLLGGPIVLALVNLLQKARPLAGGRHLSEADRPVVSAAMSQFRLLGTLMMAQVLYYPLAAFLIALLDVHRANTFLYVLVGEGLLVGSTVAWCLVRASRLARLGAVAEARRLSWGPWVYLGQFLLTRGGIVDAALCGPLNRSLGLDPVAWILAVIVSPWPGLLISYHARKRILTDRGAENAIQNTSPVAALCLLTAVLALMAGMLLPASAKAKAKASSVSAMSDLRQLNAALEMEETDRKAGEGSDAAPVGRVRRDFPETLYWQPELITDDNGRATVEIPLADAITTWRMSVDAVSAAGRLGSLEAPIRVFQDFFVEPDLPVALSLGDEISAPVMCYNYLDSQQTVRVTLDAGPGLETADSNRSQAVTLGAHEVKAVHFPVRATGVGVHRLTVTARGERAADVVERAIRVLPTGERVELVENSVLRDRAQFTLDLPVGAIPGSAELLVKVYPSRFSEVVDGLDAVFQAPYGCFEQTSSTTYPNVLALDYLKQVGKIAPEVEIKARKHITAGYQRLLTFEVPGGGFDWFGHPPANAALTAYGLMEFTDMSRVHPVDPALITRTAKWLADSQNSNGSWGSAQGAHWWQSSPAALTAYIAWALAESGQQTESLRRALEYLDANAGELKSTYLQALAANAFLARDPRDARGLQLAAQLRETARTEKERPAHWTSAGEGMTYSRGPLLAVETTALGAMALMKSGIAPETVKAALTWLSAQKCANGTWGCTQPTILAMRALIRGTGATLKQDIDSKVVVSLNGKQIETLTVNKENSDVLRLARLTDYVVPGRNRVEVRQEPPGDLPFQVAGVYWLPKERDSASTGQTGQPIEISLECDRTQMTVDDTLTCRVRVRNHSRRDIPMAIVDLGIPPGFELDTSAFRALVRADKAAKFEVTGNQAVLYLRQIEASSPFEFACSMRAKWPLRVQAPVASVCEYYTPANRASSKPATLTVAARGANGQ